MKQSEGLEAVVREVRQAVDELVADGTLIVVKEIDPATGNLRNRYYLRDHAPKPS